VKGYSAMTRLKDDPAIMRIAKDAFLTECGPALIKKYGALGDELFTEPGFRDYADDLLNRITNPYLADTVARAGRDVVRKLGVNDRIFGTMQLALDNGIEPRNMAIGDWPELSAVEIEQILNWLWSSQSCRHTAEIVKCVLTARDGLQTLIDR